MTRLFEELLAEAEARGFARGFAQGVAQGRAEVVAIVLSDRFGTVPPDFTTRLTSILVRSDGMKLAERLLCAETWEAVQDLLESATVH